MEKQKNIDEVEAERRVHWMLWDCLFILISMTVTFSSSYLPAVYGLTMFTIGLAGSIVTITEMVLLTYSVDQHMKKVLETLPKIEVSNILPKPPERERQGVLWIWAVALIAICVMAIAWFALSWPAYEIIESVESSYSFPSAAQGAINLAKSVIAWFLIIMILGFLFWAIINSGKREDQTYPI